MRLQHQSMGSMEVVFRRRRSGDHRVLCSRALPTAGRRLACPSLLQFSAPHPLESSVAAARLRQGLCVASVRHSAVAGDFRSARRAIYTAKHMDYLCVRAALRYSPSQFNKQQQHQGRHQVF
mmetsp:Transcript_42483/g.133963  ORF Transcript_42483/g.133963 Transcript_42483/m.133963 type:complete len:122 (+) Transcript_42483:1434-1799(+)